MFAKLLARHLVVFGAAALLSPWATHHSTGTGAVSDFAGFVLGVLLGACAFLLHEWGHLLGAFATRSVVTPSASLRSHFHFDSRANSRRQFLVMSATGFVATGVALWVAYGVLPSELLATRVARGAVMFLAFLGVVLELPLVLHALVSGRVPPVDGLAARAQADSTIAPAA
jgi:hypothetical protein